MFDAPHGPRGCPDWLAEKESAQKNAQAAVRCGVHEKMRDRAKQLALEERATSSKER